MCMKVLFSLNLKTIESVNDMPEQIENRMVVDSEWEGVEELQMRIPDRSCRRMQRIIDEMEYGKMEEEE